MSIKITKELIAEREERQRDWGYNPAKWLSFCKTLMLLGYSLELKEACRTESKYIVVSRTGSGKNPIRVRFSAHPPRANAGCDLYVGGNGISTNEALQIISKHFFPPKALEPRKS